LPALHIRVGVGTSGGMCGQKKDASSARKGVAAAGGAGWRIAGRAGPGGHYAPFLEAHEQAVEAELDFPGRHLRKR
jgi:hypothetical protein